MLFLHLCCCQKVFVARHVDAIIVLQIDIGLFRILECLFTMVRVVMTSLLLLFSRRVLMARLVYQD